MIGWKPNPFIYVHIPKCAGTSIEISLLPIVTGRASFQELSEEERSRFWLPGRKGLQHSKIRGYARRFQLDQYYRFAFVRNPWDRAISQIDYLRSRVGEWVFPGHTFKEQVKSYCQTTRNVWGHDLRACQRDYVTDSSGKLQIDFIGRFESLADDFNTVCRAIGIEEPPQLPHAFNSNRNRHYSEYYDDESADWIRQRFQKDLECFGYEFERVAKVVHRDDTDGT